MKLLEIHLNNKKNMIEPTESMEKLIHQKKSNWTIKYVIDKILERNITPSPSKEFRLPLEKEKYKVFSAEIHSAQPHFKTLMSKCPKKIKLLLF